MSSMVTKALFSAFLNYQRYTFNGHRVKVKKCNQAAEKCPSECGKMITALTVEA